MAGPTGILAYDGGPAHPSSTALLVRSRLWTVTAVRRWAVRHSVDRTAERGSMATQRFLQLTDVAEVLNISASQTYALVRSGELPAIKIGGRGQWRVEASALEDYIARCYAETKAFVSAHPARDGDLAED